MLKRFYAVALCAGLALTTWAAPAKPGIHLVAQPDGTQISVRLVGDESFHFYQTLDGVPLVRRADGALCYALCEGGVLKASNQIAHNAELRTPAEISFIETSVSADDVHALGAARRQAFAAQRAAKVQARRGPNRVGESGATTGKHKGIVILVNFKDVKMKAAHTRDEYDDLFNKVGYKNNGNASSVHDFFLAQSYGQLDVDFDVVGPVTVSKTMASYGGNNIYGNDKDPTGMVYEACKLVDSQVNFADYDWDGDGEVDQVYVIYAGYGEAQGGSEDTIWPHEYWLSAAGKSLKLDGVKIDTYGCSSELIGGSGSRMDGIGTPCHEFSHCLGLPDVYDTQYTGNFGMSMWSVMDMGTYANNGYGPVGYTAYERWFSGWLEPTVLDKGTTVTGMRPISQNPDVYVIYNDGWENEYMMLENRQMVGTDKYVPGHGMLVTHIYYDPSAWRQNTVNVGTEYYTIFPRDGKKDEKNLSTDPYPGSGTGVVTELTDTSKPTAAKWIKKNTDGSLRPHKPITNIAESSDGLISFDFMGGGGETGITEATTARPSALTAVTVYSLDGRKVNETTYGAWRQGLQPGIYVIRTADGQTLKAACK